MGNVKIRYYVTRKAWEGSRATWGYWVPSKKMEAHGFKVVRCGVDGPHAWAIAQLWNERWDIVKKQLRAGAPVATNPARLGREYPPGSLGEAFAKFRATNTWKAKAPRTREGWERGWKYIDPVFGDVDPLTVSLEDLDSWYAALLDSTTVGEAYIAMKYWRALWKVAGTLKRADGKRYCDSKNDPSLGIRRRTPRKRDAIWVYDELRRLVKGAWRMGYKGLAAALATSWDTQFSPVDVRSVTKAKLSGDAQGPVFSLSRAKTGRAAIGTLSWKAERVLLAYLASLPFELHPDSPIFHTRGAGAGPKGGRPRAPAPYTKDTLAKDFRVVRDAAFPGDKRTIMDFRRSGAVEATAGQVDQNALAAKMANSIDSNRDLQATYQPHQKAVVRLADEARARGRTLLREQNGSGSKK